MNQENKVNLFVEKYENKISSVSCMIKKEQVKDENEAMDLAREEVGKYLGGSKVNFDMENPSPFHYGTSWNFSFDAKN